MRTRVGLLAGYDVAVLFYVARVWLRIWRLDAAATSAASRLGKTRRGRPSDVALLLAAVAEPHRDRGGDRPVEARHGSTQNLEIGLGAGSIVVSWLLVHTIFALKYARLYYGGAGEDGGIEFENHVQPPYSDFAYLAFTIGMTFQVSDTDLQTAEFRRLALRHALLSYLFGAVILAVAINLVASIAT